MPIINFYVSEEEMQYLKEKEKELAVPVGELVYRALSEQLRTYRLHDRQSKPEETYPQGN